MSTVTVKLCGVFPIGPENFLCAVLLWEERQRFLPVWLPPVGGAQLVARIAEWEPKRPDTHDVLTEVIAHSTTGVSALEISSYYNGVFMGQITMDNGTEVDCRPSDLFIIASMMDLPIEVDELVINQASIWLSPEDAADYFDVELDTNSQPQRHPESASGDAQADADFQQLMRDLGVEEGDLGFGEAGE
ncbi:bifunctional nuclease family protein [Corynebacterium sp. MSK041]|uniref:bifunctional nuclease family protein n=1 Tax=Corynebacterium sp. MSK041 TaxID=3050194 RepID=UPI0025503E20|nr:bifunctional nuclease family protein [Corynebacterium sp. MSK041]MDK8794585.1 bifunctional nuclease family protein [Corynebacterium sp. MSK041]